MEWDWGHNRVKWGCLCRTAGLSPGGAQWSGSTSDWSCSMSRGARWGGSGSWWRLRLGVCCLGMSDMVEIWRPKGDMSQPDRDGGGNRRIHLFSYPNKHSCKCDRVIKKKLLVKYDTFGLFQDKTRKLKIKMNSIQNSKSFNLNNKTGHPSFIKKSDLSPILTRLPELLETITKHASYCCFLMCHLCG